MNLSDVLRGVAHKRLTMVDISGQRKPGVGSNQHELNAGMPIRELLSTYVVGDRTDRVPIQWVRLEDDADPVTEHGTVRLYDARSNDPSRSAEWRLHYDGEPLEQAVPGDLVIFVLTTDARLHGLIVSNGSEWHNELERVFGVEFDRSAFDPAEKHRMASLPGIVLDTGRPGLRQILLFEQLGIDLDNAPATSTDLDIIVEQFGTGDDWPTTARMIALAQQLAPHDDDPDEQLLLWLSREHELFRALERVRAGERIREGFIDEHDDVDVDQFISYSLSMNNRRKSRMGHSLEGHLASIFQRAGIAFDQQKNTEGRRKPDFLFPGQAAYRAAAPHDPSLVMLAAKSTCKDRWRQILNEAAKIPTKHLCTLQPSLSEHQLREMDEEGVVLVVPRRDLEAYAPERRRMILSIAEFIEMRGVVG